jgi:uncharacterized UBP type Zn finger protein
MKLRKSNLYITIGGIMKKDSSGSVRIAAQIQELVKEGGSDFELCSHAAHIQDVVPSADGCEKCLEMGDRWIHLRLCLTCGHVGCCDNSKNKHARHHYHETHHPMIVSYEPRETWLWCYEDKLFANPF